MPTPQQIADALGEPGWTASPPSEERVWRAAQSQWEQSGMHPTGYYTVTLTKPGMAPKTMTIESDTSDPGGWRLSKPPADQSQPAQVTQPGQTLQSIDIGGTRYTFDPKTGGYTPGPGAPNPDEAISTAVKRQTDEATRNARQRNEAATGYYVDDAQRAQIENQGRQAGLDRARIDATLLEISNQNKNRDAQTERENRLAGSTIGVNTARTGQIGAETAATQAQTDYLKQKAPAEIEQMVTVGLLNRAQADKILSEIVRADRPTPGTPDVSAPYTVTVDPKTGQQSFAPNKNYLPKDTGAQISGLQQQASQKRDELNTLVQQGQMSGEQAAERFNQWWDSTVEPRRMEIQATQQQQQFNNQLLANAEERQRMTTAQQAQTNARLMYDSTKGRVVGAGVPNAFKSILDAYGNRTAAKVNANDLFWEAPDPEQRIAAVGQQALEQLGGARITPPAPIDLASALDRTKYNSAWGGSAAPGASNFWEQLKAQTARVNPNPTATTMTTAQVFGGGAPAPTPPLQPTPPAQPLAPAGVAGTVGPNDVRNLGAAGANYDYYDPFLGQFNYPG